MGARTKARKRALDLLFEADQRGLDPLDLLAERQALGQRVSAESDVKPVPRYAAELVTGVTARRERIDELLATYATGWTLDRMPAVDRALLRLGTWEVLFNDDVPDTVAISEAVTLAGQLSTDDSPNFINGLLSRIESLKPTLID